MSWSISVKMAVLAPMPKRQGQHGHGAEDRGFPETANRVDDIPHDLVLPPREKVTKFGHGCTRSRVHPSSIGFSYFPLCTLDTLKSAPSPWHTSQLSPNFGRSADIACASAERLTWQAVQAAVVAPSGS